MKFSPYLTEVKEKRKKKHTHTHTHRERVSYNAYSANWRSGKLSVFIRRDMPVNCTISTAHYIVSKTARRHSLVEASCMDTSITNHDK